MQRSVVVHLLGGGGLGFICVHQLVVSRYVGSKEGRGTHPESVEDAMEESLAESRLVTPWYLRV